MHTTAYHNATKFYNTYCIDNIENKKILDVGSWNGGNGCLRPIFNKGNYIGLDVQKGPNVDVVGNANDIPFSDNTFDIVVSSSCFEHDPMFWISFLEICRVTKKTGYIYICAPSSGPYHPEKCPGDSWRFYPDSWKSLCLWANHNKYSIDLIDSYIDKTQFSTEANWQDSIGIFQKNA